VRLFPARFRVRNDVGATRDVVRIAREVRPDWLIGTFKFEYWPLAAAARLLRIPLLLFSHLDQRMQPWTFRLLPRLTHRVVAPSEYQRQRLIERGMPAERVEVLYNPVDTAQLRIDPVMRREARAELGFTPDDVVVGYVGRMEPGKGVATLVEALTGAMGCSPRVRALWVGHGESEGPLREGAAAAGHAARHVWRPWAADVLPYYAAMDVLALPSVGRETFGRVLVEAQACGVPGLGSRTGGIPETMEDGVTGHLLPPGDARAWEEAILRLTDDDPARRRMGRLGREFVERVFDARIVAAEFGRMLASPRR
jgi:glycosyltransferase involved in cell wall biosynthesis